MIITSFSICLPLIILTFSLSITLVIFCSFWNLVQSLVPVRWFSLQWKHSLLFSVHWLSLWFSLVQFIQSWLVVQKYKFLLSERLRLSDSKNISLGAHVVEHNKCSHYQRGAHFFACHLWIEFKTSKQKVGNVLVSGKLQTRKKPVTNTGKNRYYPSAKNICHDTVFPNWPV